jgi:3-deoxy-D-arabino-heptulosonate 7-phosphate (DAHP) synthase class II
MSPDPVQNWHPYSWQNRPAVQQPSYPDAAALADALERLSQLPPLVTSWEVESLRNQFAQAEAGQRFVLQGGDCAESFADCRSEIIANRLKVLLQMSLVLVHGMLKPGHARRPFCRPVCQAAQRRHRDSRRRDLAGISRRHRQCSRLSPRPRAGPIRSG